MFISVNLLGIFIIIFSIINIKNNLMFVDIRPLKKVLFITTTCTYFLPFFYCFLIIILSLLHKALHIFYFVPTL